MPAAELQKVAVKFFARDATGLRLETFIPIFHRWIQTKRVEGLLIDVADYSHLPEGPGVVLIGHEADYSIDSSEGPLGLLYSRKQPAAGGLPEVYRAALAACARLEEEPELRGKLSFAKGEALLIANDRLAAPNEPGTFEALRPSLEAALASVYKGARVELRRREGDPRRRLAVEIRIS